MGSAGLVDIDAAAFLFPVYESSTVAGGFKLIQGATLSYLKRLPLDQIKIDQSFVRDIATDPNDAVMVQTIINLAQNFRLNVIAEGVETEAQLTFLKEHRCMAYQGYFFSKPVPIEQFEALLK